ncbi:hypothetical protein HBI65_119980 [Parastagonospora nodorum]|nr:hypothetical protein HBI65_119980 [Parastagonospora nodorum]
MPASTPSQSTALHILVHKAESLITLYPQRFSSIEAAKAFISDLCNLDLATPLDNKVAFLVAIHAFENGEFYLDTPPPSRQVLRNAIESAICTLLAQIRTWPCALTSVAHAQSFLTATCPRIHDLTFAGLPDEKFQRYVSFNTARRAWEMRAFDLHFTPDTWKRAPLPLPPPSLSAAIQRDIDRLTLLLPPWPRHFSDLNAARDWVRGVAEKRRFRYTGWEGVEGMRYRCFVQFNLARGECGRGVFGVDEGGERVRRGGGLRKDGGRGDEEERVERARTAGVRPVLKKLDDGRGVVDEEKVEQEQVQRFNVSTAPYGQSFREFKSRAVVVVDADEDKENEPPLIPADSMEPLATIEEVDEDVEEEHEVVEAGEEEKPDPFAALVADLRREFILKAAFD